MATRYKILTDWQTQSITWAKTFDKDKILVKWTSTGTTNITTANTSATNYTATLPAKTGTIAMTSDVSDEKVKVSALDTTPWYLASKLIAWTTSEWMAWATITFVDSGTWDWTLTLNMAGYASYADSASFAWYSGYADNAGNAWTANTAASAGYAQESTTQDQWDNSTNIATTAYVDTAVWNVSGWLEPIRIRIPWELVADASNYQWVFRRNTTWATITISNVKIKVATAAAWSWASAAFNLYKSSGTDSNWINTSATALFSSAIDLTTNYTDDTNVPNTTTVEDGRWISMRVTASAGATNKASDVEAVIYYS